MKCARLQEIISKTRIISATKNRINLESNKYRAAIRLDWNEKKKTWLLTAFEKKESAPAGRRTDISGFPMEGQNDTAPLPGADSGKVNKFIPSLGAAEVLRQNASTLDYNGYTPSYEQLESYDHLIDKADLRTVKYGQGGLKQSLDVIRAYIRKYSPQVRKLAHHLRGDSTEQTAFNCWHFCKAHIRYAYDKPGTEQLRTPARSWNDRFTGIDCDDYSIFIACLLQELGIPWKLKVVAFNGKEAFSHIYPIVPVAQSSLSGIADKIIPIIPAPPHNFINFSDAEFWAKNNITGRHNNNHTGKSILISKNAVAKFISESAVGKSSAKDLHLSTLRVLPRLIENAALAERHPDSEGDVNIEEIQRFYAAVGFNNTVNRVKITVKVIKPQDHRAYSYEVLKVEMPEGKPVALFDNNANRTSGISLANLLKGARKNNGDFFTSSDLAGLSSSHHHISKSSNHYITLDAVMNAYDTEPGGITKSFLMNQHGLSGFRIRPFVTFALGAVPATLSQQLQALEKKNAAGTISAAEKTDLRKLRVLLSMANVGEGDAAAALLKLMPHIRDVDAAGRLIWNEPRLNDLISGSIEERQLTASERQRIKPVLDVIHAAGLGDIDDEDTLGFED